MNVDISITRNIKPKVVNAFFSSLNVCDASIVWCERYCVVYSFYHHFIIVILIAIVVVIRSCVHCSFVFMLSYFFLSGADFVSNKDIYWKPEQPGLKTQVMTRVKSQLVVSYA